MIYCILWKRDGKHEMFTNQIFNTEKDAIDFAKRSKLKKKHDCRIKQYDYKYFDGVILDNEDRQI
jgi:hypothetical protein